MEIETLKKDNRKYWIIGIAVVIILASVVFFVSTRANYRVTEKVNIANGTINYSSSDLNVMAIKVQNSSGGYDNANSVPTSGYTLSSSSYCEINGTKDTSINMEYKDGKVYIGVNAKNTKCYLYFDPKPISISDILAGLTKETRTDFSVVLTENTTGKIYTVEDNDGTSYYYAGAVDNNWVKFGGFYWRIIRVNGDGTLRLIYNGTTTVQTGTTTRIGTAKYSHKDAYYNSSTDNSYVKDNAYVGYMYGATGASTYNAAHTNTTSSNIKQTVDTWYNTNLNKTGIKEHIDTNAGFCGDRTSNTSSSAAPNGTGGYGTSTTYYGAYNRLDTNKTPSLKCTNSNDLYTVSNSSKGNKALTYPVGLITADEVAYAGGKYYASGGTSNNQSYYLYTNSTYWTMSPYLFSGNGADVFCVGSNGYLYFGNVSTTYGARPVINLKADTLFTKGDGSKTSPFEI